MQNISSLSFQYSANATALNSPLSKKEVIELDSILSDSRLKNAMSLEMIDGYFCALTINPVETEATKWLPLVFGSKESPLVSMSAEQVEHIANLLTRYCNATTQAIAKLVAEEDLTAYQPLLIEPKDTPTADATDVLYGHDWATGFRLGTGHCHEIWQYGISKNSDILEMFTPIALLEMGKDGDERDHVQAVSFAQRQELVALLPTVAGAFAQYWASDYGQGLLKHFSKQVSTAPRVKVGRNEPCPCGSGKKYKKCCGQ